MDYYVNAHIKNTPRVFPMQGRYGYLRYDMNENPQGLPQAFVDSVLREITPEFLATYPEPDRFLQKYAAFIGVRQENVLATNGSDMGIRYLLETFGEPGKEVVTVSPSFEMYWVNCSLLGLKHVPVSYHEDLTMDVSRILAAIGEDTRIVVLLNPNNPVGNVYTPQELESIIAKAKQVGAIVIIDEAYHYFYDKTFLPYAIGEENVVLLRTFSKLMSLAACRLGVVISNPDIIHYVKNGRLSFDTNAIALLFGERLLDNPQLIGQLIAEQQAGKDYTLQVLRSHGYACRDCTGNFIFITPKTDPKTLTRRLQEEHRILVHAYGNPLLSGVIRVSTGAKAAMEPFLEAFLTLDQPEKEENP